MSEMDVSVWARDAVGIWSSHTAFVCVYVFTNVSMCECMYACGVCMSV